MKKLIIQIPCLNEEQTLPATIADLPRRLPGIDVIEYLVIDDGSRDGTVARRPRQRRASRRALQAHQGPGRGVHAPAWTPRSSSTPISSSTPTATISTAPPTSRRCSAPLLAGDADIVIGDRNIQELEHLSPSRKWLQRLGSWVVRQVSNTQVPDTTSGFRAYTREAALRMAIVSDFSYTLESIIHAGKRRMAIAHVPVRVNPRTRESRLFDNVASYIKKSAATIVRIYASHEPLKVFSYIGGTIFGVGLLISLRFLYYYLTGAGAGHLQSLILSAVLMIVGFQIVLIGLVADLIGGSRKLLEDVLYRVRSLELRGGAADSPPAHATDAAEPRELAAQAPRRERQG